MHCQKNFLKIPGEASPIALLQKRSSPRSCRLLRSTSSMATELESASSRYWKSSIFVCNFSFRNAVSACCGLRLWLFWWAAGVLLAHSATPSRLVAPAARAKRPTVVGAMPAHPAKALQEPQSLIGWTPVSLTPILTADALVCNFSQRRLISLLHLVQSQPSLCHCFLSAVFAAVSYLFSDSFIFLLSHSVKTSDYLQRWCAHCGTWDHLTSADSVTTFSKWRFNYLKFSSLLASCPLT